MKQLLRLQVYILILSGHLISMTANADIWDIPRVTTYHSENKEFKLIITPKMTPDKYNLWNYYKTNKHPQTKRILRQKDKFMRNISEHDTIIIPCIAELYKMIGVDSVLIWKRPLLNQVCPVYAIVANDGSSIATFDNWYSIGYGVNVFVIYDEKGNAKKTYKLEEITPFPLNDYSMSVSSLYWRKDVRYIDNDRIEIIFETNDNRTAIRIYNLKRLEFD